MTAQGEDARVRIFQATVMFVDVTGFTPISDRIGAERAYAHFSTCLGFLDAIARRHGAAVDKYLGDALMAVFGYPRPLSDAPAAAIRAALEMRERMIRYNQDAKLEIPLGLCIGINTGPIYSGESRGSVVREFHVLGDTVNTAARIKSKAPSFQIYVGPETRAAASDSFEFHALEPVALKGKQQPVVIARVDAVRSGSFGVSRDDASELFGRDRELEALRSHVSRLRAGSAGVLLLQGEEGMGKSRLLGALAASPECADLTLLASAASPLATDTPFQAFAGLTDSFTDEESARAQGGARARKDDIAGSPRGGRGRRGAAPLPAERQARLEVRLLAEAAKAPLLVLLDELQFADAASLERLPALCALAERAPISFVLALRPGAACRALLARLEAQSGPPQRLELGPLAEPDAIALVRSLSQDSELEGAALARVLERAVGNPQRLTMAFFVAGALPSETEVGPERSSETERRHSTVLFADLTGFTAMCEAMEPEQMFPIVSDCMELLNGIAVKHGGTVDKHLGDCVLALFGIPRAMEDAPRAAVNAAIEMLDAVDRFNQERQLAYRLDAHIGINTGLGIAGEISGPLIREFAVMGDSVVIASNLTDVAIKGEIYVGEQTQRFTRDEFEYRSAPPLELKGRAQRVKAFELVSRTQRLYRRGVDERRKMYSPLVGRDDEMKLLTGALEALHAGQGGVVSLIAEAGTGKSRLVAELGDHELAQQILWLQGRSISTGRQQSYHPFADLCRSWAGIGDRDDEQAARGKLHDMVARNVGEQADEIFPFIASTASARLEEAERERLDRIQGESREQLIRSAIALLLRSASEHSPVVILMDDLHWSDLSSLELLESLFKLVSDHPVLMLLAFRPGYVDSSGRILEHLREHYVDRHIEIELGPLAAMASRELIKNLFREGNIPQLTRRAIEEKTQGNPFYIEEVVRTLADLGAVEYRDGSFHATEKLASVEIPGTVQEAVMARVDRLPLGRKSALQAASVIGGSFHFEVLEGMLPPELPCREILDALDAGEFIEETDRSAGVEYAFKHPLIQEVTYDSILETRREELHYQVAQSIEGRLGEDVPGYSAMLAYHFGRGGKAEKAEHYLFEAGDQAARMSASSEALYFFREASSMYMQLHGDGGDLAKKALLEKNVAQALLNRGQLLDAVEHFDLATGLLGAPAARKPASMMSGFALNLVRVLGRLYLPLPRRSGRPATERDNELFDVMFRRAMAQSTTEPIRFFVDCVALLRRLSAVDPLTVPESAAMYSGVVGIFAFGGISFDVSRRFLDIARDLAEHGAVDERRLYCSTLTFMHHMLEGNWSDEYEPRSGEIEEGIGQGRFWEAATCLNLVGVKHIHRGDFDRSRTAMELLQKLADVYEHDLAASALHAVAAYLHTERREFGDALRAIELYYDEHREPLFNLQAFSTRAKVQTLMGEREAAAATLERAGELLAEAGRAPPWHASTYRSARYLADVDALELALRSDSGDLSKLATRAAASRRPALAAAAKVAWRRPEVLRLAGVEMWLAGREREAFEWWRRAIDSCEQLGARPELGRTWQRVGEALAASEPGGGDARVCIQAAREIFSDLDLGWDLARVPGASDLRNA